MEQRATDQARADQWRNLAEVWTPPPTHRYAIALFGRRVTPWRTSHEAAIADALAAGHAEKDEWGTPYMWAGADVVSERLS